MYHTSVRYKFNSIPPSNPRSSKVTFNFLQITISHINHAQLLRLAFLPASFEHHNNIWLGV